eukprot:m.112108 g.112108  ORF g.112108 m.112108 type:complete len:459 (-) comp12959_c0_seq1:333-1709(-)
MSPNRVCQVSKPTMRKRHLLKHETCQSMRGPAMKTPLMPIPVSKTMDCQMRERNVSPTPKTDTPSCKPDTLHAGGCTTGLALNDVGDAAPSPNDDAMPTYLKPGGLNVESKQLFNDLTSSGVSCPRDSTDDTIKLFYVTNDVWTSPNSRYFLATRGGDGLSASVFEVFNAMTVQAKAQKSIIPQQSLPFATFPARATIVEHKKEGEIHVEGEFVIVAVFRPKRFTGRSTKAGSRYSVIAYPSSFTPDTAGVRMFPLESIRVPTSDPHAGLPDWGREANAYFVSLLKEEADAGKTLTKLANEAKATLKMEQRVQGQKRRETLRTTTVRATDPPLSPPTVKAEPQSGSAELDKAELDKGLRREKYAKSAKYAAILEPDNAYAERDRAFRAKRTADDKLKKVRTERDGFRAERDAAVRDQDKAREQVKELEDTVEALRNEVGGKKAKIRKLKEERDTLKTL